MKLILELDDWQVQFLREQLRVRASDVARFHDGPYEKDDWAKHYATRIMLVRNALKMDQSDMYLSKDAIA